jgi:hypothetical protein
MEVGKPNSVPARDFADAVNAYGVTSCSLAPTMLHGALGYLEESETELPPIRAH